MIETLRLSGPDRVPERRKFSCRRLARVPSLFVSFKPDSGVLSGKQPQSGEIFIVARHISFPSSRARETIFLSINISCLRHFFRQTRSARFAERESAGNRSSLFIRGRVSFRERQGYN